MKAEEVGRLNKILEYSKYSNTRNLTTTRMILLLLIEFSDAGVAVYGGNVYPHTIFKLGFIEVYLMYLNIVVASLKMIYIRCLELIGNF